MIAALHKTHIRPSGLFLGEHILKTIVSACCALALLGAVPLAQSQTSAQKSSQKWPERPVRIIIGFSPGSSTDFTARTIGPRLSELWGQPVIYENRSGAGGSLANATVAKATPDGYTLSMISSSFAVNYVLAAQAPYDPIKEFVAVTQVGYPTSVLATSPSLGIKTVKELIAMAHARPGKFFFGTTGAGSGTHMTTTRFNMAAGIKPQHVAFKGQPELLIEIVTGRVHFGIPGLGPSLPMIKDNRLVPLAVVTPKRAPQLPDVPAMIEVLPTFERDATHGLMAPAGTPRPIREKIAQDVARVLEIPEVKKQFEQISFFPAPMPPDEYQKLIVGLLANFERVAREAGLKK
jgi:tripartite-type tricarboxylate transporter receptor subunit TctC